MNFITEPTGYLLIKRIEMGSFRIDPDRGISLVFPDTNIFNDELSERNFLLEPCSCLGGQRRVGLHSNHLETTRKVKGGVVAVVHPYVKDERGAVFSHDGDWLVLVSTWVRSESAVMRVFSETTGCPHKET